jgi:hypothetical protein
MKKILLFLVLFLNLFPLGFNFEKGKMLFPGSLYGQYQGVEGECINGYMTCDCDGWILFLDCSDPGTIDCQCIDSVIITPPSDFTCPICGQDPCVCGYYDPCSYGSPDYSDCACLGINCDYGGCDPSSPYYDECTCLGINCDDGGGDGSSGDDPTDPPDDGTNDGTYNFDTSNLTTSQKELFIQALDELDNNCFFKSMLSSLQPITVSVNSSNENPATYLPLDNKIVFRSDETINAYSAAAEMFHGFQDTYYGDYLDNLEILYNTTGTWGPGFSNIEFEEKFMGVVQHLFTSGVPGPVLPQMEGVDIWVTDLFYNNNETFPASFTLEQSNQYMTYLNNFREWNATNPEGEARYTTPVDNSLPSYPAALFEIIINSNCHETE